MRKVLATLLLIACVSQASAQSKWSWKFGLGGTLNTGNVENQSLNTTGSVERNDSVLAFDAHYAFIYGQQDRITNNLELSGGVKFDIWQYNTWSPFFADEAIHNIYKGLDFKNSILAGLKWKFLYGKGYDYSLSAAIVGDYTDYHYATDEEEAAADLDGWKARLSLRFKAKQKIGDNLSLKHTTFYQPNVVDFSDYLVTSTTSLETQINKNLTFNIAFTYDYKSVVPAGTEKQDITTTCGLTLKF